MVTKYHIYGILYNSPDGEISNATISAESSIEAESMLEQVIVEKLGYEYMKSRLHPTTIETTFKTNKKGIISGYDYLSSTNLQDF